MNDTDIFKIVEHEVNMQDNLKEDSISNLMQYLNVSKEVAAYIFFVHSTMQELRGNNE